MLLRIEVDQDTEDRWSAEVGALPGVLAYGASRGDAIARAQMFALREIADRLEDGEVFPETLVVTFEVG